MKDNNLICKSAQYCINKGYIDVNDNVIFKTIRDVSDLFNKNYRGFQKSWIKIFNDWKIVASCYQMPENKIYKNELSEDGQYFYYSLKEDNPIKKELAVDGIINHEMEITYLFLKNSRKDGYKFVGVCKKDIDKMNKYKKEHKYLIVYKKIDDRLYLDKFFNKDKCL